MDTVFLRNARYMRYEQIKVTCLVADKCAGFPGSSCSKSATYWGIRITFCYFPKKFNILTLDLQSGCYSDELCNDWTLDFLKAVFDVPRH